MSNLENLPVLILAYNRLEKLIKCIETISQYGIKKIYVSIDGPKNNYDYQTQLLMKKYFKNNYCASEIIFKQINLNYGCRIAPIMGINWFFNSNKYGVVLEDDLFLSRNCFKSFYYLLDKFKFDKEYMSITSFNEYVSNTNLVYSMPVWRSWGWATWSDKWLEYKNFSKRIRNYDLVKLYSLLPNDLKSFETVKVLKACQLNLLDAWDYEFNFFHIVNNYKSLTLGGINNFVYGFDQSATHTKNNLSVDVDFSLFKEREFDLSKIKKYELISTIEILKKCGFYYSHGQKRDSLLILIILGIFYDLKFKLRLFKRNFLNNITK